jgi:hypothetical protein
MVFVRARTHLPTRHTRVPLLLLGGALAGVLCAGCGAPPGGGADDSIGVQSQPATSSDSTVHSRAVRKWSNAVKYHGKQKADYLACAGDRLRLAFTFENLGSALWRDVNGRGDSVGSDVFLVTASGKTDRITGHKHYSIRYNRNHRVRGDRNAKNCSKQDGCRRTTFTKGGMVGQAPWNPGTYHSRWRLRDYSSHWGTHSEGFGHKVDISFEVVDCSECGCSVACSSGGDGKSHVVPDIQTDAQCQAAAAAYCVKGNGSLFVYNFKLCPPHTQPGSDGPIGTEPPGGSGGSSSGSGGSGYGGSGYGGSGYGGSGYGGSGAGGAGGAGYEPGSDEDPNGYDIIDDGNDSQVQDDPGFSDDGFNGDADFSRGSTVAATGCAVAGPQRGDTSPGAGLFLLLTLVEIRRRAGRQPAERG